MSKEFKVGDIVRHSSGIICNGRFGEVAIGPYDELCVLDNEGAPDMDVEGNEDKLEVVGTKWRNPDLLRILKEVSTDRMYIVVREKIAREDLGHAMLAVTHAVGAAFRDWATDCYFCTWAHDSFRKFLAVANEKEWSKLKELDIEKRVMTECAMDGEETAIVFKPRKEWPNVLRHLRPMNAANLGLVGKPLITDFKPRGMPPLDAVGTTGCKVTVR